MSIPDFAPHEVPGAQAASASTAGSSRRKGAPSRIATLGAGMRGFVQQQNSSSNSSAPTQRSPLQQVQTFEEDQQEGLFGGRNDLTSSNAENGLVDSHILSSYQATPLPQPPTTFPRREASLQGIGAGLPSSALPSAASSSTSFGSALPIAILAASSSFDSVTRPTPPRLHRAYSEGQGVPSHSSPEAPTMTKGLSEGIPQQGRATAMDGVTRSRRSGSVGDLLYAKDSMVKVPDEASGCQASKSPVCLAGV